MTPKKIRSKLLRKKLAVEFRPSTRKVRTRLPVVKAALRKLSLVAAKLNSQNLKSLLIINFTANVNTPLTTHGNKQKTNLTQKTRMEQIGKVTMKYMYVPPYILTITTTPRKRRAKRRASQMACILEYAII